MSAAQVTYGAKPVGEVTLRIWRAVASGQGKPLTHGALLERLAGRVDSRPLTVALEALRRGGYVRKLGKSRYDGGWTVTRHLPLGEETPLWMQEATADEPEDAVEPAADGAPAAAALMLDPQRIAHLGSAFKAAAGWPFEGPVIPHPAVPREKAPPPDGVRLAWRAAAAGAIGQLIDDEPAPADAEPLFALYSDGRLMLQEPGQQPRTLAADTTRALFRWLDRLQSATSFAETASADEAAA